MTILNTQMYLLLFSVVFITSCGAKDQASTTENTPNIIEVPQNTDPQISEYIRHIFQDKNGNLWFGTNGDGVAHYDGVSVSYYSNAEGFGGQQITGITEDPEKNIWFATDHGIVKYDWSTKIEGGKRFTNYTDHQYFGGQRFWSIFADSKGLIWAGSATDIFLFDGVSWTPFDLPYPEEVTGQFITDGTCMSIIEDKVGNMWFATMGFGAFKFDPSAKLRGIGKSFTQYSKKDGLTDDSVDQIMEDSKGNIWFGTRHGGLSRYDGMTFTNYTAKDSIGNNEVCVIFEDKKGNIWFSSEGYGVYRYNASTTGSQGESLTDGKVGFTNYSQEQGLGVRAVQTIFEDQDGRLWVGGGGGLYRYEVTSLPIRQEGFINVTKNGPWK